MQGLATQLPEQHVGFTAQIIATHESHVVSSAEPAAQSEWAQGAPPLELVEEVLEVDEVLLVLDVEEVLLVLDDVSPELDAMSPEPDEMSSELEPLDPAAPEDEDHGAPPPALPSTP